GKPGVERAEHLLKVDIPMLFVQGTRDDLAKLELLEPIVARLGALATLKVIDGADHSFHVPAKTRRTDADVREEMLDSVAKWVAVLVQWGRDGAAAGSSRWKRGRSVQSSLACSGTRLSPSACRGGHPPPRPPHRLPAGLSSRPAGR